MRKKYMAPAANEFDMQVEGMIASSIKLGSKNEKVDTGSAYSQEKGADIWGNGKVW